jgi:hypothetical protein
MRDIMTFSKKPSNPMNMSDSNRPASDWSEDRPSESRKPRKPKTWEEIRQAREYHQLPAVTARAAKILYPQPGDEPDEPPEFDFDAEDTTPTEKPKTWEEIRYEREYNQLPAVIARAAAVLYPDPVETPEVLVTTPPPEDIGDAADPSSLLDTSINTVNPPPDFESISVFNETENHSSEFNPFEHADENEPDEAQSNSLAGQANEKLDNTGLEPSTWFEKVSSFLTDDQDSKSSSSDKDNALNYAGYRSEEVINFDAHSDSFRRKIAHLETRGSYTEVNGDAIGKYQFQNRALVDTGYMDEDENWTGKGGIESDEDFLNDPDVQEKAFDEFMDVLDGQLGRKGSYDHLGTEFPGVLGKGIVITKNGLIAAAHRAGAGAVSQYLAWQRKNNWSSNFRPEDAIKFKQVEKRIREFQNVD